MSNAMQGLLPTVWFDGGADGRVMVADSQSYFEHEPWLNDVAVGASFAGAPIAAMPLRPGVKAWIAHAGGPGKDNAGVSGLVLSQRFGVPALEERGADVADRGRLVRRDRRIVHPRRVVRRHLAA